MARTSKPHLVEKQEDDRTPPAADFSIDPADVPSGQEAPAPTDDQGQPLGEFDEFGVAGAKIFSGYVEEEFLKQLTGDKGRKVYREMRDNDATVGAILFAIEMLLRSTPWTVEIKTEELETATPATPAVTEGAGQQIDVTTPEGAVAFLEGVLFDDMQHTWDEFLASVLTFLQFGWQYTEMVFKRRMGLNPTNKDFKSKFDDGMIGIRKLGYRPQETLDRWLIDEDNGDILGMWQYPPNTGRRRFIPYSKSLLFRPTPNKDSPEGRSILRNAYRPWYMLKTIQEIEAIGIERELAGLPVVYIPNSLLNSTDPNKKKTVQAYEQLVRDVKFNSQGGVVLPSDTYKDVDGKPTTVRKIVFELVSAGGTRAIDTNKVIQRYQGDIARSVLADFIMLGQGDKGSFALSRSKADLFLGALEGFNRVIASVLNRRLVPLLWELNGFDMTNMPYLKPGKVAPEDLEELGNFISLLARGGFMFSPDDSLESHLREVAGLPERDITDEEMEMEEGIGEGLRPGDNLPDDDDDDDEGGEEDEELPPEEIDKALETIRMLSSNKTGRKWLEKYLKGKGLKGAIR